MDWGAWEAMKGGRDVGVAVVQVSDVLNLRVFFFQQSRVVGVRDGVVGVRAVKVVVSNDVSKDAWCWVILWMATDARLRPDQVFIGVLAGPDSRRPALS
jgi:hypothetical protein